MQNLVSFKKQDMGNGVWRISQGSAMAGLDEYVDAYLVCGQERAVLIDSLMDEGNLYSIIRKLPPSCGRCINPWPRDHVVGN